MTMRASPFVIAFCLLGGLAGDVGCLIQPKDADCTGAIVTDRDSCGACVSSRESCYWCTLSGQCPRYEYVTSYSGTCR